MSNPFPGMDPWLEATHVWPGMHDMLIVRTVEFLQPGLRSRGYYADIGERVWLSDPGRGIVPDDVILHRPESPTDSPESKSIATVDPPVRVARTQVEVRETYVEIFDAVEHELVTALEFLSPSNKENPTGRNLYQNKQTELRDAGINLVEVDLLRRGPHVLDIPVDVVDAWKPWQYLVNLVRRAADDYEFHPVKLRDRLPRIGIPLKAGDEDVVLDLQEILDRSYDIGPYPERLLYSADPPPPALTADDAAWADELLKSKGLRK